MAASRVRDFHVRRSARERYGIDASLLGLRGDLLVADLPAIRVLAARMSADPDAGSPGVTAGEILALGLLHEVAHLLIERYDQERGGPTMPVALDTLRGRLGHPEADRLLDVFGREFPGAGPEPEPPVLRLEELLLTRVANENPALGPLHPLVDDRVLRDGARYEEAVTHLEGALAAGPSIGTTGRSLADLLREPARHAPTSLVGQLRYIREQWGDLLGDALADLVGRLEITIGVLVEEELGLHRRFGGGDGGGAVAVQAPSFSSAAEEPEAFSSDSAWMPQLVLMAKSTYVWLDQLSRRYGREIRTLDAIPDAELETLRAWGVTGLWLIGLWQRSVASERIKRMRGNEDAVASAYSLDDYRIADDLGGEAAYADLRDRAWTHGIRLASDMVPNHMGIDSRWVIEHPEWFLSLPQPPYPAYTFTGADLSSDERVGIVLEDHYWDATDAAVVFKRIDRWTGDERYVYHGNDGTSFPWNDTAQLDFLEPAVREHVIRTIIDVARRFPVIRFDAAMVLAKKHVQRLWWPLPGEGGGIPSRAEHALTQAQFDARMPAEFWREVVDRVAAEVPGTLLLAEAFWMLEGYFVRTLGMHRVYNSAFMHMLRDEDGPSYRRLVRETLEFDPEIMKRYVNFMSNPDEETAVEQFGKGDKYFGVATVMATLPGLPMLGHGQVEGFGEKYGMEYRRATLDEQPDRWLVERHERELFPILHRRAWFAEVADFLFYDFRTADGVDEHVLAYSNGTGPTRSLVVYHDRYATTAGWIRDSLAYAEKSPGGSRRLVRRPLAQGLGLPDEDGAFAAFRDARTGLEYLRSCRELREQGLWLRLEAYQTHVFWEFREVHDGSAGQWSRLAARLAGAGVPSLEAALRDLQLEPVHVPLRAVLGSPAFTGRVKGERGASSEPLQVEPFLGALAEATGLPPVVDVVAASIATVVERATALPEPDPAARASLLTWSVLSRIGELAPGADVAATSAAWFEELRLGPVVAAALRSAGLDEAAAWAASDRVRTLLRLPRSFASGRGGGGRGGRGGAPSGDADLLRGWLADPTTRTALGVNTWEGVEWVDGDRLAELARWSLRLDAAEGRQVDEGLPGRLAARAAEADYRVERLLKGPTSASPRRTGRPASTP